MKSKFRVCPICADENVDVVHHQKFSLMDNAKYLPSSYDLVSCDKCGFVYADTSAEQSDYDKYYCELSKYEDDKTGTGGGGSVFDSDRMKKTADDVSSMLADKKSSILDIGCANGGILALLKEKGYKNVVGLDPSQACVLKIEEKSIEGILGGLFDIPKSLKGRKFDCIILSHVMEHVRDLSLAMDNVIDLLNENGLLYIEVPNAEQYCKNYVVPYYYFDSEHINHFDLNALKNLGALHGLSFRKSVEKMMQVSATTAYPAIGMFYDRKKKKTGDLLFSKVKEVARGYVSLSKDKEISSVIDRLFTSQEEIVVWGAGQFTQRLLGNTKLGACNIVAFIDNDSVKQKQKIKHIPINDPSFLKNYSCPVLICSALHGQEIADEITRAGLPNKFYVIG